MTEPVCPYCGGTMEFVQNMNERRWSRGQKTDYSNPITRQCDGCGNVGGYEQ